jgi:hypothetical protein
MLSGHADGLTEQDLRLDVEKFLKNPKAKKMPWYLGVSARNVRAVIDATKQAEWFPRLLERLREDDWLINGNKILKFKRR